MNISQRGLELIKKYEGFEDKPYVCSGGKLTIGYGFTFYPDGKKVRQGDYISKELADEFLEIIVEKDFAPTVTKLVKVKLSQNQFDALCSFAFNLGVGNLAQSTLLKKINKNDFAGASEEFGKWVNAGGQRLEGLVKRRASERELFLNA